MSRVQSWLSAYCCTRTARDLPDKKKTGMGCKTSKEASVANPHHNGQRRPGLKINLDFVSDGGARTLPPLQEFKLGGKNDGYGTAAAAAAGEACKEAGPSSSTSPSSSPAGSSTLAHTPAVTPQASWTAEGRRSSRTTLESTRGGYAEDGSSRRREGSRRRTLSTGASSSGTGASREDVGGRWESEDDSGTVANRGRADTGTTIADELPPQRQLLSEDNKRSAEEVTDSDSWPPYPPVLLVLHLFLENHRPPDVPSLPGNGGGGGKSGPSPLRRLRLSGDLAYEGQLRRRRRRSKGDRGELDAGDGAEGTKKLLGGGEDEGAGGGGGRGGGEEEEGGRRRRRERGRRVPHGWGRLTFPDGAFYEGTWRGGVVHGKGALHLPNGNAYLGSWARGRKHGHGSFVWADGSRHEGFYAEGERNGPGKIHYASGAVFEGEFKAGLRHGVGCLKLAGETGGGGGKGGGESGGAVEGASYDGEWANDVPHGFGVFVSPAGGGERFEGTWRNGLRSGQGTLVQGWAEEEEKEEEGGDGSGGGGECDDVDGGGEKGEVEGRGGDAPSKVAWYSGSFEDGLPDGDGMMQYGSASFCGHVEQGSWKGGGRFDFGERGKGSFEGSWHDGLPSGSGRWKSRESGVEADCTFEEGYSR